MRFARQGWPMAAAAAALAAALGAVFGWAVFAVGMVLALGVLLFFRDPERSGEADPTLILAPADGRVVAVGPAPRAHRFDEDANWRVSIFMSPLDVHVNRMPVAAAIRRIEHRPGSFRAAYADEASEVNESNSLLLEADNGLRVVVVQIAGWLARRIVCYAAEGATLARGERFGLIMFGSRVDVFLPASAQARVAVGDRTRAGETVLARVAASEE